MIDRLIDFSVRNRVAVLLVAAVLSIAGWFALRSMPVDALPDTGDVQVIILSRWDRSPDLIESQVTYPIVTSLLGAPRVKTVRASSDFGFSFVYVVFEDGTDPYWARSRVLEYLSGVQSRLPEGVKTELGPDASGVGWIFQYALIDESGKRGPAELRSLQDWNLRYAIRSVHGVAEVASLGGFVRQYQVNVDPVRLKALGIPLSKVIDAVKQGNSETSGSLLDVGGAEFMVRGRGYATSPEDFGNIVLAANGGSPVRIRDVAQVSLGPEVRRAVADLNGEGEVVSGIVVMRNGENAVEVIGRVKQKIAELQRSLPEGVKIVPVYDRSELIRQTVSNTRNTIIEVVVTVVLIILVFLWHFPSAVIPIVTMPVAVLLAFIPLRYMGLHVDIMLLSGVAIAFGELIDASIVIVEQTHKKLEAWRATPDPQHYRSVVLAAMKEVSGPTFFALLVLAISFLPILALDGQEGRMFRPLALSKSMAMIAAALLALTLDPALRMLLTRVDRFSFHPRWLSRFANLLLIGEVRPERDHALSRRLTAVYEPIVRFTLRHRWKVIGTAAALVLVTIPVFLRLGSEFMPPFDEGAILYMPTTAPGISVRQAGELLHASDAVLKSFPQVAYVLGKAGRADTATDPAPLSMLETTIVLKPRSEWPRQHTWYSAWAPEWLRSTLRHITPDTPSTDELIAQMDAALKIPGVSNSWTKPIRGRLDMLSTGLRSPLGLKVSGPNVAAVESLANEVQTVLQSVPGTRAVFAERIAEGHYLDILWNRDELARYGISIDAAQASVTNAIGGDNIGTVVLDRERYPVSVRYLADYRRDGQALEDVLVSAESGVQVPLRDVATVRAVEGPSMIRDEDGQLTAYVFIDPGSLTASEYVSRADKVLTQKLKRTPGTMLTWSGQYESMERVTRRLQWLVPLTLALVLLLLRVNTRSWTKTGIVLLAVPFSAVGAAWFLYLAGYHMSIAVWVGLIALLGVDAETGVFMLLYLDLAYHEAVRKGRMRTRTDLHNAILQGAASRLRPKFMTFATTCIGLFPIMWSTGTGADLMKRIAAPMVGGILTSFLLELLVYPAIYSLWRSRGLRSPDEQEAEAELERLHLTAFVH